MDVIPLDDFPHHWRLIDPRWESLPDAVLARLQPLSPSCAQRILERAQRLRNSGIPFVNTAGYYVEHATPVSGEPSAVVDWLNNLPVDGSKMVFVSWSDGAALATDWKTFAGIWDRLWYPLDVVNIFDDSLDWGVLFGPEEYAVYIKPGSVNDFPGERDFRSGYGLMQVPG